MKKSNFDLRKTMFILPNLCTISSIFCGFYSIVLSTSPDEPDAFWRAGIAIFAAILFDMLDGRIARLTKTQSDFGVQIDSLADFVSFGVAPSLLVYRWSLERLDEVGFFVAFIFAACGAIRLARFNVLSKRGASSNFFIGLPIPASAGMLVSVIMAHERGGGGEVLRNMSIAFLVLVLSYLMISNVRYRTFKNFKLTRKSGTALLGILCVVFFGTFALKMKASLTFTFLFSTYVMLGLVEEVIRYGQEHPRRKGARRSLSDIIPRIRSRN